MKYTHPAYVNEKIETSDVICESPFSVVYEDVTDPSGKVLTDENGNPLRKTVIGVDVSKLF